MDLYRDPDAEPNWMPKPGDLPPWPPVTALEIHSLINQLKTGKAPGEDLIQAELIKHNPVWWAPVLASLFTYIDRIAQIPKDLRSAIVVPIFKKGNKSDPSNYRRVSLLSITSKMYARHLLGQWSANSLVNRAKYQKYD